MDGIDGFFVSGGATCPEFLSAELLWELLLLLFTTVALLAADGCLFITLGSLNEFFENATEEQEQNVTGSAQRGFEAGNV